MEIGDYPCVWTDDSLESCHAAGVSIAGAGVHIPAPELAMGETGEEGEEGGVWGCVGLSYRSLVPFTRFRGRIIALQAFWLVAKGRHRGQNGRQNLGQSAIYHESSRTQRKLEVAGSAVLCCAVL